MDTANPVTAGLRVSTSHVHWTGQFSQGPNCATTSGSYAASVVGSQAIVGGAVVVTFHTQCSSVSMVSPTGR